MKIAPYYPYTVVATKKENEKVTTLTLSRDEEVMFKSGQCLTVYFPETKLNEGKAYSISSAPHEKKITITVKDMGLFSHKLCSLSVNDTVLCSHPYGFFFSEEENSPLVLLAGGVGIAPFLGMIKDVLHKNPSRIVRVYYSVQYQHEALFLPMLRELCEQYPSFEYTLHVTREEPSGDVWKEGRIPFSLVARKHIEDGDTEYFVCGSISFVRDAWKGLREASILDEQIYTEAFFK